MLSLVVMEPKPRVKAQSEGKAKVRENEESLIEWQNQAFSTLSTKNVVEVVEVV
jgi:hypothetical protein